MSCHHNPQIVFWHRELPPMDAEPIGEYTLEASSRRIEGTIAHRDELWDRCYGDLMATACVRFEQELRRLGGHYAHVLEESVEARHDDAAREAWLHGMFRYVAYRRAGATVDSPDAERRTEA